MLTQDDIVARVKEREPGDLLGFEWHEYLRYLDFEHAQPWLKKNVKAEEWKPATLDVAELRKRMEGYMQFAWDKANNCRGISANRSIQHYIAWSWLMGDVEFSEKLRTTYKDEYEYYGKPLLRMICDQYGWDAGQWDDGIRTNTDS